MNPANHRFAEAITDRRGLKLAALLNQGTADLDH